jgi:hypothetical protein
MQQTPLLTRRITALPLLNSANRPGYQSARHLHERGAHHH